MSLSTFTNAKQINKINNKAEIPPKFSGFLLSTVLSLIWYLFLSMPKCKAPNIYPIHNPENIPLTGRHYLLKLQIAGGKFFMYNLPPITCNLQCYSSQTSTSFCRCLTFKTLNISTEVSSFLNFLLLQIMLDIIQVKSVVLNSLCRSFVSKLSTRKVVAALSCNGSCCC